MPASPRLVEIVRNSQTSKVHIMKSTAPYAQTGLRTFGDSSEIHKFDSRKVSVLKCTAALRCPFSDLGLSITLSIMQPEICGVMYMRK
jgi:hypothetical protein